MALGKVDCIGEFNYLAKKIRARAETADDAGNLLASGPSAPEIISGRNFAGGFSVFGNANFCRVRSGCRIGARACVVRWTLFIARHRRLPLRPTSGELFFSWPDPAVHRPARQHHSATERGFARAVRGEQN